MIAGSRTSERARQKRLLGYAHGATCSRLDPLTFHQLRHTYASRLVMRGVPLTVVARQLGHKDTRMGF